MIDYPWGYRVGYSKPPLHSRFKKGQSGNPQGGRGRKPLAVLLDEVLDRRGAAKPPQRATRRETILAVLVEQAAAGDLRATRLLLDLIRRSEAAAPPEPDDPGEDPREFLKRAIARLAARQEAEAERKAADNDGASLTPPSPPASEGEGKADGRAAGGDRT